MPLLETIKCGAILLDDRGFVVRLNQKAARMDASVRVQHKRLHATEAVSDQRLQSAVTKVLDLSPGNQAAGQSVRIPRPGRRPLALRVMPLGAGTMQFQGGHAMVLVFDPEESPKPDELLVRQVFGLTPAEWRVAEHLIGGDSLDDIAVSLGITVSTVRTQLRSTFAKTQSHRQTELIATLIQLTSLSRGSQTP